MPCAYSSDEDAASGVDGRRDGFGPFRTSFLVPVVLFIAVFVGHGTSPNVDITDSLRAVPVAQSIVHRGTISLDAYRETMPEPGSNIDVVDGRIYPHYPWAISLFAVPVIAAVDVAHLVGIGPSAAGRIDAIGTDWEFQVATMSMVVAATAVVVYLTAMASLSMADAWRRRRWALVAALVFAFATPAWSTASRSYWQHGPSMLLLSLCALGAVRARDDPRALRWMGLPLAASYAMRPTNAVPVVVLTIWVLACHRRYLIHHLAAMGAVLAPFVAVNLVAYGSVVQPYYGTGEARGGTELLEALAGTLVSPSRGLFVFSPILVLAVVGAVMRWRDRRLDGLDVALVACVVGHWSVTSIFASPAWWGGYSYGPRLLSDIVPFLVVLALPALDRLAEGQPSAWRRPAMAACSTLLVLSVLINFSGAYFRSSTCWNAVPISVDEDPSRVWDWSDPQFLRGPSRMFEGPDQRTHELMRGTEIGFACPALESEPAI